MPAATPAPGETGRVTIDLGAIARNWQALAAHVAPAACAAVVKADAYGLGAKPVVRTLRAAGCETFFVATAREADDILPVAEDTTIYVLNGLVSDSASHIAELGVVPVLSTLDDIRTWHDEARARNTRLRAVLHVDSGLNRLGLSPGDVALLSDTLDRLAGIDVVLNMSHLASADTPEAPENAAQLTAFRSALLKLPPAPASLAASDGLMLGRDFHFDLVRPGYALYGGQAVQGRHTPVEPTVTVTSKVLQVRALKPGDTVGYGASYCAAKPMRLAIVSAGYADGVPRAASAATNEAGGAVAINGIKAAIVGRVSMDLIAVDVTHMAQDDVAPGSDVELIGPVMALDDVGAGAGTIGYEILTRLSRRFECVYLDWDSD